MTKEIQEKQMVEVTNRDLGSVGYTLNDGTYRKFEHNETKKNIPLQELQELSYLPGGEYILKNCLVINDKAALDVLNLEVEPEYFYKEEDIKEILLNGSLDQLEDTLNFAPTGVIEIIKNLAVELEIPDVRKRDMISEKTGFSISNAILVNHVMEEDTEKEVKETPKRKVSLDNKDANSPKRKTTPKYNVVSIQK